MDEPKLLVVFGAGASFDSVPKAFWTVHQRPEDQPPLANQVSEGRQYFVQQLNAYNPWAGEIVPELRGAIAAGRNIEEELQRFATWSDDGDERTQCQLMALRFYLKDIIEGCTGNWISHSANATNYGGLMNMIERWRAWVGGHVEIVTFNYDFLLERALSPIAGREFTASVDDFIRGDGYRVYKLHGSVDWLRVVKGWWEAGTDVAPRDLIARADMVQPTDEFVVQAKLGARVGIPAIAIPTISKTTFECPASHAEALMRQLPAVNRILVVGWKGQEQTFISMLNEHLPVDVRGLVVDENLGAASDIAAPLTTVVEEADFRGADVRGFSGLLGNRDIVDQLLEL